MGSVRHVFGMFGLGASASLLALGGEQALAQAPAGSGGLDEVVVTAQHRSEAMQTVPISMSAITGATLEKMGDKNFFDYASTIPNLSVGVGSGSGGDGSGFGVAATRSVTIRGVAGNNTTAFYLNDTPVPLSVDPRVLDIDRVEVLRGPQGTLFGAGSMGGAVRIITREPALDSLSGKLEAEGFNVDHGGAGYSIDGTVNIPLIPGVAAARVGAFNSYDPGLFTRKWGGTQSPLSPALPFPPGGVTPGERQHVAENRQTGAIASLRIVPPGLSNLTLTPMFMYQRSAINGDPLADYSPGNFVQIRPLDNAERVKNEWTFAGLTAKYDASFGRFVTSGTYFHQLAKDHEDGSDAISLLLGFPYYISTTVPGGLTTTTYDGEVRFESALKGPVQFVVGAFYEKSDQTYEGAMYTPGADAALGGELGSDVAFYGLDPDVNRQRAAYLNVSYDVTPALQVAAGVRRAHLAHEYKQTSLGYLNGGVTTYSAGKHAENVTTPRYTARYEIAPNQTLYASAAKGFRIGGTNDPVPDLCIPELTAAGIPNGGSYNSDSLWSYEVGSKNSWFGGRMKTRLAAYRIDWNRIQQTLFLSSCGFTTTVNAGAAKSNGAEFELDAAPLEHLTVNLSFGYEHARITVAGPGARSAVGHRLTGVPDWTAAATAQYTVPLGVRSLFIRGQYTYTGPRLSYNNEAAGRHEPGYNLVDLRVGFNQGNWEAAFFTRNLFNRRAVIGDIIPDSAELAGRPRWEIVTPRTIGLDIRRDF